jgi:hypothetical protein
MASKKEIQEKELKTVLGKDISTKNPVFSPEHITELHALFCLYADPRQRRADVRDLLVTASTLGLDTKYEFVFRVLQEVHDGTQGAPLDFEQFLRELTNRVVRIETLREVPSPRKAAEPTSPSWTSRQRENLTSMTCATSTTSSNTATMTSNWWKLSTPSAVMVQRPFHGISSTNSSKGKSTGEESSDPNRLIINISYTNIIGSPLFFFFTQFKIFPHFASSL